ncbi:MAG: 50S ribosomal protein L20 [Proteobacteria bacterium]|nr:50S ribosomal protein L20 [Pseudomonadota bacterium]
MARVKRGFKARRRRNRVLKQAKGFFGSRSRLFRVAEIAVMHSHCDAYKGRRLRKRNMRRLWITRIGAAAKQHGTNYSRLIGSLTKAGVTLNRKILADLAIADPSGFTAIVEITKGTQ